MFNYKESSAPPVTLGMTRPKGYYKIIATDLAEFEESGKTLNDIRVEISYKQFVSTGYNTITQSPNKYQQTHTYSMDPLTITENGADAALVGYDYVFVNGTQSTVKADLMVYDSADNLLRTTTDIEIPLVRNKQTIIKGQFLTTSFGSGGMDVDEEFEGEIIIPVN